jgi:hypothetical protein
MLRFTAAIRSPNTPRHSPSKPKRPASQRPKLLRISEEMREWSAMLEHELSTWPRVNSRPMFGLAGFYREKVIFAALPRTRALTSPNSFIFKFNAMSPALSQCAKQDPRINSKRQTPGAKWYSFELHSANDIRDALWWLNQAYEAAK